MSSGWLAIIFLTGVTIACRGAFLLLGSKFQLPSRVQQGLRYAPLMALVAIVVPDLLLRNSVLSLGINNPRLYAGIIGFALFAYTRSMLATIVVGMLVLTFFRLL